MDCPRICNFAPLDTCESNTYSIYTDILPHENILLYPAPSVPPPSLSFSLSLLLQSATTLCDVVSDTWKVLYGSEEEEEFTEFTMEEMSVISMISLH